MTQKTHFFKLGLFVILSFLLTAAMLIAFGAGKFFETEFLAETCFDESVQGLDIGSEVKYKGVKIGTVKAITTPTKVYGVPSSYVLVVFALSEDCYLGQTGESAGQRLEKAVSEGLGVALAFKGLTGAAYLETDYLAPRTSPLTISWQPEHTYVPSRKSNIKRVGDAMNQVLESLGSLNINGMVINLERLIETLNQKAESLDLAGVSSQAEALLKELRTTNQNIDRFIGSESLSKMVTDAGETFFELKTMVQEARDPVNASLKQIEAATASISRVTGSIETDYARRIEALLSSLDQTARRLESLVWLNADTIQKTVENFQSTSENLNQLTLELKKYPGRLLLERPPRITTPEPQKEPMETR